MPRPKKTNSYIDPIQLNSLIIEIAIESKQQFYEDLRTGLLVRFRLPTANAKDYLYFVIVFTERFAYCIGRDYLDDGEAWPSSPTYSGFSFNSGNTYKELFREIEEQDFDYNVISKDGNDDVNFLYDYVDNYYYDRRNMKWNGWGSPKSYNPNPYLKEIGAFSPELFRSNYDMNFIFKFWQQSRRVYGIDPWDKVFSMQEPTLADSFGGLTELNFEDLRDVRFLEYDMNGNITGAKEELLKRIRYRKGYLFLYHEISLANINGILYVVSIDQMFDFMNNKKVPTNHLTLISTFDNWVKYNVQIEKDNVIEGTGFKFDADSYVGYFGKIAFDIPQFHEIVVDRTLATGVWECGYVILKLFMIGDGAKENLQAFVLWNMIENVSFDTQAWELHVKDHPDLAKLIDLDDKRKLLALATLKCKKLYPNNQWLSWEQYKSCIKKGKGGHQVFTKNDRITSVFPLYIGKPGDRNWNTNAQFMQWLSKTIVDTQKTKDALSWISKYATSLMYMGLQSAIMLKNLPVAPARYVIDYSRTDYYV